MRALPLVLFLLASLVPGTAALPSTDSPTVDPSQFSGMSYRMIGPHRGGRVTAVAGVLQDTDTFYMGATGGGVWKTTNSGGTWENVSDGFFETASIGAVDVSDSDPNVVWVGTGSAALRSNIIVGRGVYRSTSAGRRWSHVGLREAGQIGDLVVHPEDPDTAWVAAVGQPFRSNVERGVFRSRDGGATWQKVLFISEQVGAVDLSIDPTNPRRLFATAWRAERKPWTIISGSEDSGLWRTDDGGDTWQQVTNGLPEGLVGKMAVEISPADPSRVWVLAEAPGEARGLYRSDDGGDSFRKINGQLSLTFRPFYYIHMTADPSDPDRLWVNNETLWRSQDGGENFQAVPTPHGDNHDLWIHPDLPRVMVQGNDGGANVSRDGGRNWSPQWNQPTAEMYQVAVDDGFPYRVYGAQQDNTTISVPSRITRRPLDPKQDWLEVSGCETGPVVPDPSRPGVVYGGCKGRHSVWDASTQQVREYWVYPHFNYGHDTRDMPQRFQRVAPMIVSPHDPSVLYHGSHQLHRSSNEGQSWETISPDLTAFEDEGQGYSGGPITRDITGEEVYSALYAIAESPHEQGVLWTGSNDGPVHVSRDGGGTWNDVTPQEIDRGGRVNRIDPSPHTPGRAWVTIYRDLLGDDRPYLMRADNWGASWTLLTDGSNGIPGDHPVRVVREDPERQGLLYVGTEFGLYVSFDGGEHFQSMQLNLPVTPISGLIVHRGDLVVATMGRSFWILDDLGPLRAAAAASGDEAAVRLLPPSTAIRARWVSGLERQFAGYAPEYPPTGAVFDYVLARPVDRLELEIWDDSDEQPQLLRRFIDEKRELGKDGEEDGESDEADDRMAAPDFGGERSLRLPRRGGHHRVRWDLRAEGVPALQEEGRPSRGALVVPGTYRVVLRAGEVESSGLLEVGIDPRVAAAGISQDDLQAQFDLQSGLLQGQRELREAVLGLRTLRSELKALGQRADVRAHSAIRGMLSDLVARVEAVEGLFLQTTEGKVGAELEPQLRSQIGYLAGMISGADQRPGDDAYARWKDLRVEIDDVLAQRDALNEEVAAFGEQLEAEGLSRLGRGDD